VERLHPDRVSNAQADRSAPRGPHHSAPIASRLALLIVCLLAAPAPSALDGPAAPAPSLEDVMGRLAASGGVRATYQERKHLSLLSSLESEGKLYFEPPDRLARHVEKPGRAWMAVRDDQLVMRDATGEERLQLGRSDVARGLVEGLAVVLRGDLALLNDRYEVAFRALESGWRIDLTPRSRPLRGLIASMAIEGMDGEIRRVEVHEENGDRTVTELSGIETAVQFTPEQSAEIFLLPPSPPQTHD
jgi:outer membrane lipoprotein-sorting protein